MSAIHQMLGDRVRARIASCSGLVVKGPGVASLAVADEVVLVVQACIDVSNAELHHVGRVGVPKVVDEVGGAVDHVNYLGWGPVVAGIVAVIQGVRIEKARVGRSLKAHRRVAGLARAIAHIVLAVAAPASAPTQILPYHPNVAQVGIVLVLVGQGLAHKVTQLLGRIHGRPPHVHLSIQVHLSTIGAIPLRGAIIGKLAIDAIRIVVEASIQASVVEVGGDVVVPHVPIAGEDLARVEAAVGHDGGASLAAIVGPVAVAVSAQEDVLGTPGVVGVGDKVADLGLKVASARGAGAAVVSRDPLGGRDQRADASGLFRGGQGLEVVRSRRRHQRLVGDDQVAIRRAGIQCGTGDPHRLDRAAVADQRLGIVHQANDLGAVQGPLRRCSPQQGAGCSRVGFGPDLDGQAGIVVEFPLPRDVLHGIERQKEDLVTSLHLQGIVRMQDTRVGGR